ncbi:MAG: hypothetical protein AAFR24_05675 [Cyanobacteria bacterium J06627_3]
MSSTSNSGFKSLGRDCPICSGERRDCRQSKSTGHVHCRSGKDSPGWTYTKDDAIGFGIYKPTDEASDQASRDRRRADHQARQAAQRAKLAGTLNADKRDRQYRKISHHSGLANADRQALLDRGLSNDQIDQLVAAGVVWTWQPGESFVGVTAALPGVDSSGQLRYLGGTLTIGARDLQGRIVGAQVRGKGNYYWVSSSSVGGFGPQLASGENPIGFYQFSESIDLDITEGFLKPAIASLMWGGAWMGAAGRLFHSSSEQVKHVIAAFPDGRLILNPDGGAVNDPNTVREYWRLNQLVAATGRTLNVRWWGQVTKADGDVDEISTERYQSAEIITWDKFWAMVPRDTKRQALKNLVRPEDRRTNELAPILGGFKRVLTKVAKPSGFGKRDAKPAAAIEHRFKKGERLEAIRKGQQLGYKHILDVSGTGAGKSTTVGLATAKQLDALKLWYLTAASRKPSTAQVEANYTVMPVRHGGMVSDTTQETPLGRPVLRQPRREEKADTRPSCVQHHLFPAFAALGINVEGEDNPICEGCPQKDSCPAIEGLFKHDRREAMTQSRIRSHPQSLNTPGHYDYGHDVLFWDEAGQLFQYRKEIGVNETDINRLISDLDAIDQALLKQLRPILQTLRSMLKGETSPPSLYGWNDAQLSEVLPAVENLDDLVRQVSSYYARLDDLAFLEETTGIDTAGQTKEITSLKGKLNRRHINLRRVLDELSRVQGNIADFDSYTGAKGPLWDSQFIVQVRSYSLELQSQIADLQTDVDRFQQQLDRETRQRKLAKYAGKDLQRDQKFEKLEKLAGVQKRWLVNFLHALARQDRHSFRLSGGELTISSPEGRYVAIANAAKNNVFLDATLTRERLAQMLQCKPSEIYVIEQADRPANQKPNNLQVIQIADMGKAGRQRSDQLKGRIAALAAELEQRHPGLGVIDYKSENSGHYWFRDNRGSNEFKDSPALLTIGTPCPNLASLEADHIALTGKRPGGDEDLQWTDFVRDAIDDEFWQGIGRPRAQLRPDEQVSCYIVSNHPLPAEFKAKQVKSRHITISAATPAEQVWSQISEFCAEHIEQHEILPSQKQISAALGFVQGQISKLAARFAGGWKHLKKIFQTLVELPKANGIFLELPPDRQSEVLGVSEMITAVAEDPPDQVPKFLIDLVDAIGLDEFAIASSQISPQVRGKLLKSLLISPDLPMGGVA